MLFVELFFHDKFYPYLWVFLSYEVQWANMVVVSVWCHRFIVVYRSIFRILL